MSAYILSDKEISSLLKLAAAALDGQDLDVDERSDLISALDRAADALDFRRGLTGESEESACIEIKAAHAADLTA